MTRALERDHAGNARVIPIILHPCDWHSASFGNLRATPLDGKAVSMFPNQNEALSQVAKDIRGAVEELGFSQQAEVALKPVSHGVSGHLGIQRSSNLRVKKDMKNYHRPDCRWFLSIWRSLRHKLLYLSQ